MNSKGNGRALLPEPKKRHKLSVGEGFKYLGYIRLQRGRETVANTISSIKECLDVEITTYNFCIAT